ncbi:MAG: T9SS type A sorting domain-containing protein [Lentisphaeria bacterium]|nr:T9SS type A sorting domain-containing protein [Candidatus Neomarinimicrobiota bacterium]MCF7842715.1 T9SS type A sorting domain-containing protein [Lentisphaeria bacterium]
MKLKSFIAFSAILTMFYLPKQLDACRLWSVLSDKKFTLNDTRPECNNYYFIYKQGTALEQLGASNPSGWGIVTYTPFGIDVYRGNRAANISAPKKLWRYCEDILEIDDAQVTLIMGHIRNASSGCTTVPDPHPYVWEKGTNGAPKTYTFAHNGGLPSKQWLVNLIGYEWLFDNGGLETFNGVDGCGGIWWDEFDPHALDNVVDSEIYFKWIMKNIQENGYDVLKGIHAALSNSTFKNSTNQSNLNFTFSDGDAIWAYRNYRNDTDGDNYTLYWSSTSGIYSYPGGTEAPVGMKAVMSEPPDDTAEDWIEMIDDELVYLPRGGNVVSLTDFHNLPDVDIKHFSSQYNWVGFPILPNNNGTDITDVLGDLAPDALSVQYEDNGQFPVIDYDLANGNWPSFNMNSIKGYKVAMSTESPEYNLALSGYLVDPTTPIQLHSGVNWVPYTLPGSQAPEDALPQEVLDVLTAIKSQHWFMINQNGNWVVKWSTGCINPPCVRFDYGSMYELTASEDVMLQWEETLLLGKLPDFKPAQTSFNVQELPDYTPVIIENIDNPQTAQEVGLFIGETCIAAEPVTGAEVKMQAYNGNANIEDATLQIIRSDVLAKRSPGSPQALKEAFKPSRISRNTVPGGTEYYTLDFDGAENVPTDFKLHLSSYPNPFNPSTTIQFNLVSAGQVTLTVYDLMGREIQILNTGRLESGNHRINWDASTRPSGLYFVRLSTAQKHETRKIILMK